MLERNFVLAQAQWLCKTIRTVRCSIFVLAQIRWLCNFEQFSEQICNNTNTKSKLSKMETRCRGQVGAAVMPPPELNDRVIYAARGQALPPSPARLSRTALDGSLAAEYDGPTGEPASPNVASNQTRPKNTKKTVDVRWTDVMKDKLVQQVYYTKAYKRTTQTKEQKFIQIQKCLLQ